MQLPHDRGVTTVLCDADGTLFPSEEPAFDASADIVNAVLGGFGLAADYTGLALRRVASGRNFRSLVPSLLAPTGAHLDDASLSAWSDRENVAVTERLAACLRPDAAVGAALERLRETYRLALVSSSPLDRLGACLEATGLSEVFPEAVRFSAQDSLPSPSSKPDPAVYLHTLSTLGIGPDEAVAVEDAEAGVRSAVAAGVTVIGFTGFVPSDEAETRRRDLARAGAETVAASWDDLVELLIPVACGVPA